MEEQIKKLKEKIEQKEELTNKLKQKQEQFDEENKILIEEISNHNKVIEERKDIIKEQVKKEYYQTGNKKHYGGIGIQVRKKLIYDSKTAITWAKENMPVCIKEMLDKKVFESFAKSNEVDIVDIEENVIVTFPSKIKIE